jgi:hypothetical protein
MTQDSSATVEAVEFLEAIRQREVQMQGAALSLRNWYDMEVAYNALRDKIDAEMIRLRRASLNTPADKPNSATMVKVADQFLRHRGLLEEYNHWLATGGEMLTTQAVEPDDATFAKMVSFVRHAAKVINDPDDEDAETVAENAVAHILRLAHPPQPDALAKGCMAIAGQLDAALSERNESRLKILAFLHRHEIIAALNSHTIPDTEADRLREALTKCRDQFQFYANEHTAAGKLEKAATNQRFSDLASSAIGPA